MTHVQQRSQDAAVAQSQVLEMRLEVIVIPVSDVDRAKAFYTGLGWREDADVGPSEGFRVVQVTPPGSGASVIFGAGLSSATPGSAQGLHLVVDDIEAARSAVVARGATVSEVFHDAGGVFHHAGTAGRLSGPDPRRTSYGSFASFEDPDGNAWVLQEITARLPGRLDPATTTFSSTSDLSDALRRAAAAHGEHEARTGAEDPQWSDWYARYIVSERAGQPLPS